jgi:copper chaperone CopZ
MDFGQIRAEIGSASRPDAAIPLEPMKTERTHAEELDLAIPDMDSEKAETDVKTSLEALPGIISVRLLERGAFARYNPNVINKDQICIAVRQAGYRASIFQDSKSGQTGRSSQ